MSSGKDSLAEVAPTLAELKKLPMELKSRLLLAHLAKIGSSVKALNKHNLMMIGDHFGLADGYPDSEKAAVRQHLLAAPWERLVHDGLLADFGGQGFYTITLEGQESLQEPLPSRPVLGDSALECLPTAFLSYSWDDDDHKEWTETLAKRLRADGVHVILDKWELLPGKDRLQFMEQGVAKSNFVIIVCTREYAKRADERLGGVGYEAMVITGEMAGNMQTYKFIPVLRDGTFRSSLPIYLQSRIGIDLSSDPPSEVEYEKLLRMLHGEPIQPPPVGPKPDFSARQREKTTSTSAKTTGPPATINADDVAPPVQMPNAIASCVYEKPGTNSPRETAYVREWNTDLGTTYSIETTRGAPFHGSKAAVSQRYRGFYLTLRSEGYKLVNCSTPADPDFALF